MLWGFNFHYFVWNTYLNLMQFLCGSYMLEFPIYVLCIAKCAYKFVHKGCKSFSPSVSVYACLFGLFFNFNVYLFISFSSDARLPSTWLTVARIPIRDFNNTNWEDCQLKSSLVHPHNEDQENAWSQNPTVQIHSNFFKRKRWTRSKT